MASLKDLYANVDSILSEINVEKIDPNANDYILPDGYYLCEVVKMELTESKKGNLQIKGQFKSIQNASQLKIDSEGDSDLVEVPNTNGRMIFKYWPLTDKNKVESMIKDMLKFEGDEEGTPLLSAEYFTNSEILEEALDVLSESRIWLQLSTKTKDGESSQWANLISWSRAKALDLE